MLISYNWLKTYFDEEIPKPEALAELFNLHTFEVDFVAKNSRGTIYYQVALTTHDESTLQKELRPLQVIRDHYPKIILTMDEEPEEQYDGIRRINARDWLLGLTE